MRCAEFGRLMAQQNLSRRGQQNPPKIRLQVWFLRAFETCNPHLLDDLLACRDLVDEVKGRGHAVLWRKLAEHAEWVQLAPHHLERSSTFPGEVAATALVLHARLTAWKQQLLEPPEWFLESVVFSLVLAEDEGSLRLRIAPSVYDPVRSASIRVWHYPPFDGEDLDETYIAEQVERFRVQLNEEVLEANRDLVSDPNVMKLPRPSPRKPKRRFEWAARFVAGESVRAITDRGNSDGTNIRKLAKELLDQIDWPLSPGTKTQLS
jgi:hypothetical protein